MKSSLPWPAQIAEVFTGWWGRLPATGYDALVPRLPNGPHWGIIEGFEEPGTTPFDRAGRVEQLMDTAAEHGASLSRIQVDWRDLETAPGVYDQTLLDSLLAKLSARGQYGFVTLGTLDSESVTLPDYLMTGDRLRDDLTLDDGDVVSAFAAFLDWFVPQLTQAGVWGLAIGNEIEFPIEEGLVTEAEAEGFLLAGLAHVQSLDADLAATVTVSTQAMTIAPELTQNLADASDLFSVNFYGDSAASGPSVQSWSDGLDRIRESANGKPVFFQELGMPIGYAAAGLLPQSGINSSLEAQQAFFAFMGREIARDPQLIGATVFQLLDWSPDLTAAYFAAVAEGDFPDFYALFAETLETIGLVAWADGQTRPAWDTWLHAVESAGAVGELRDRSATAGSDAADALSVSGADVLVFARDGDDTVTSGQGQDAVDLGLGPDAAHLGAGDDIALGRGGADTIRAGAGNDWVAGGWGRDAVFGAHGADTLSGGGGDDFLRGGNGRDALFGDSGQDLLLGGAGHDRLLGGDGDDTLLGHGGHDTLNGGVGNDWIMGGAGNDRLFGQSGADVLIGGRGSDHFVFRPGSGHDYVSDFDPSQDHVEVSPALFGGHIPDDVALAQWVTFCDGAAVLDFGAGDVLELQGVASVGALWQALVLV